MLGGMVQAAVISPPVPFTRIPELRFDELVCHAFLNPNRRIHGVVPVLSSAAFWFGAADIAADKPADGDSCQMDSYEDLTQLPSTR